MNPLDRILQALGAGPRQPDQLAHTLGIPSSALGGMLAVLEQRGYLAWVTSKQTGCQKCSVKGWCAAPTQEGCDSVGLTPQGQQRLNRLSST